MFTYRLIQIYWEILSSVSKGRDVPRDVPGQTGTGRPVVPLSWDKKKFLSRCPGVPGQGQEQMSRDKPLCHRTYRDKKSKKQKKDVSKQEKDVFKQERMF